MKTQTVSCLALVAIAAAAVAGCGGSDSNSKATTPSTPTSAPTSTAGGTEQRLSASEWSLYKTKNDTFVAVTNKSVAKFRSCGTVAGRTTSADQYVKCMGDIPSQEIDATTDLGKTLHGFHPSVAAACTTSLNAYIGTLDQWRSVVSGVQASLSSAAPQSSGSAANARTQYPQVQAAAKTFTKECKPRSS